MYLGSMFRKIQGFKLWLGAPLLPAVIGVASVNAEEQGSASSARSSSAIEEVVVTARKKSENVQDISASLTAHTGEMLDAKGIVDIKDLQNVTPGLTVTEMASYSLIFIRGIGSDAFQGPIDSSVATYIDGLYITYTSNQAQSLGNVASVTVLKGPQGTIYGRNAVGGAIVVETKKPDFEEWQANVNYEMGNYDLTKTKGHISGPIFDNFAIGLSGLRTNRETYLIYDPDPSQKHKDYDDKGYKLEARWAPFEWLEVNASHWDIKHSSSDSVPLTNDTPSPAWSSVLTANPEPWHTGVGPEVFTEMESKSSKLMIDINTEYANWKTVLGHTEFFSNVFWDYDMSQEKLLIIEAVPNTAETDSLEMVFTNSDWGPSWLSWIGGIYIEDTFKDQRTPIYLDPVFLAAQEGGLSPSTVADLNNVLSLTGTPLSTNEAVNLVLYGGVDTDAKAAFVEFTIDVTDYLSFKLGGRYSDETRIITESWVDFRLQNTPTGNTEYQRIFDYEPMEADWQDFTPNAGIEYHLTDDIMVYYSYQTAFKSGNWNGLNINEPPEKVEPENAESHEIGAKTELFSRSVRLNAALFTTTVTDGQAQILSLASGGVTRLENASEYTVDGAELEIFYSTPIDGLNIAFSGTWLKGEYDEFECTGFDPETGLEATFDCSGKETIRTPEFTGTLDISYRFNIWRFENEVGVGAYRNSGFWFNPNNNVPEDPYTKYNARASISYPEWHVKLYAFGQNLTNEVSHMQKFRQDFGIGESYARPRMWGVGLEWEY